MGTEHPSHSGVAPCSQAVWGTGAYHQLRIASEVVEEESLQYQVDWEKGVSFLHCLKECLKGYSRHELMSLFYNIKSPTYVQLAHHCTYERLPSYLEYDFQKRYTATLQSSLQYGLKIVKEPSTFYHVRNFTARKNSVANEQTYFVEFCLYYLHLKW